MSCELDELGFDDIRAREPVDLPLDGQRLPGRAQEVYRIENGMRHRAEVGPLDVPMQAFAIAWK